MKPTFIALVALCLPLGCGKKPAGEQQREIIPKGETSQPEPQAKAPPTPKANKKKSGTLLWEFETEDSVFSSPAIGSDGTVYVGSGDKKLYAINGKTGAKLWEFETGDDVSSSPAIGSDGTVYVGSSDKKLYAIKTDSKGLAKSPWPMRGQNPQHTGRALKK